MGTSLDTSRAKRLVKMLKRLIAQEHLYSDEQLKDMKKQLRLVQEEMDNTRHFILQKILVILVCRCLSMPTLHHLSGVILISLFIAL